MLFGGGGGGGRKRTTPDFQMDFPVPLEDLYNGAHHTIEVTRNVVCSSCDGTGGEHGTKVVCSKCQGSGTVMTVQNVAPGFRVQMQQQCPKCGGQGHRYKQKCSKCHGKKVVAEPAILTVDIEKGMDNDQIFTYEGKSEQVPGIPPGNILVRLATKPHSQFERDGNDLHYRQVITLEEALLGFEKKITHLDKRQVVISRMGLVTPHDFTITIARQGMPMRHQPWNFGDLYVHIIVKFPQQLTNAQKEMIQQIF